MLKVGVAGFGAWVAPPRGDTGVTLPCSLSLGGTAESGKCQSASPVRVQEGWREARAAMDVLPWAKPALRWPFRNVFYAAQFLFFFSTCAAMAWCGLEINHRSWHGWWTYPAGSGGFPALPGGLCPFLHPPGAQEKAVPAAKAGAALGSCCPPSQGAAGPSRGGSYKPDGEFKPHAFIS